MHIFVGAARRCGTVTTGLSCKNCCGEVSIIIKKRAVAGIQAHHGTFQALGVAGFAAASAVALSGLVSTAYKGAAGWVFQAAPSSQDTKQARTG